MPRTKASNALVGLVESDNEDLDVLGDTSSVYITKMPPAKPGRRPAAAAPAKRAGRPPAHAANTSIDATKDDGRNTTEKPPGSGRGRKRELPDDTSTLEEQDKPKLKTGARGRPPKAPKISNPDDEKEETEPETTRQPAKRGRKAKAKPDTSLQEEDVSELQGRNSDTAQAQDELEDDLEDSITEKEAAGDRSASRHYTDAPVQAKSFKRAASNSEIGGSDPATKRKLGDITRKYEDLEAKYQDLREVGIKEAERNFDRLKKQGEEKSKVADQLIASLKSQLATQTGVAKETDKLKEELQDNQSELEALRSQVTKLNSSLSEARTEIKTLSTKLSASRSAEAAASLKVPGSAIKPGTANNRLMANAEAAVQTGQMKENMYGDLTGLIITGIKQEDGEYIYNCIQTGRNKTLHFKLAISDESGSEDFDNTKFAYMPQLDDERDEDLIEMLPEYLCDEIEFPRQQAARFYSRVMKALAEA